MSQESKAEGEQIVMGVGRGSVLLAGRAGDNDLGLSLVVDSEGWHAPTYEERAAMPDDLFIVCDAEGCRLVREADLPGAHLDDSTYDHNGNREGSPCSCR